MTVQELFNALTFDEIMAALHCTHRNDRSIQNVAGYKEAYDIICHLPPKGRGGQVSFDVTPREEWFAPHSLPMLANNVEGDYWENTVRKTVLRPDNNPFTDAELAGAILWGMTFYGFTKRDKWIPSDKTFSHFGVQANHLQQKLYLPYIRDKKTKRQLKKGTRPNRTAFSMDVWDTIAHHRKHQNRSKRKRYHRLLQRIEQLENIDKRQHLIDNLDQRLGRASVPAKEIISADSINEKWFESHCYGKSTRIDYLIDLLSNYCNDFDEICRSADHNILVCYTADTTPLTEEEKQRLHTFLSKHFPPHSNWQLHFAHDPTLPNETALQFIGIKH